MGPQTPTTITIRQEEGKEHLIRRNDIKSLYVAELSAMPDDLDEQVDIQQMTDLLTYIRPVDERSLAKFESPQPERRAASPSGLRPGLW